MAEQTFRSPGFFEQEIDLSSRKVSPVGVPAGVIGTADRGPAFVPVTVGSFTDFETRFGSLHADRFGPYAVREFLKHRTALTYMRVLGAGANETATDMTTTDQQGTVKNAGFRITGSTNAFGASPGSVQFLVAQHKAATNEAAAYSVFTDNQSHSAVDQLNLVRGVIFTATGTNIQLLDATGSYGHVSHLVGKYSAHVGAVPGSDSAKYFKVVLSSSAGGTFGTDESFSGIRILTASLDPNDGNYISKVLNTDPLKFQEYQHLLYLDYAVEHELAPVISTKVRPTVALVSGSTDKHSNTGDSSISFHEAFGRYDTRYTTPRTSLFISQPYGKKEYDLFHFETISDGAYGNDKFKISIANLRASTDPSNPFGTFEVQLRSFSDKDTGTQILERYPGCDLNPRSDRFIGKMIGDKKVRYDFDQEDPDERRLVISGKYPNKSSRIRIQVHKDVENGEIPKDSLPFGFRGIPVLKTANTLAASSASLQSADGQTQVGEKLPVRLSVGGVGGGVEGSTGSGIISLTGSIVPPIPFRFKVTRGTMDNDVTPFMVGAPGTDERVDGRYYWGVNTIRIPTSDASDNPVLESNAGNTTNPLVTSYTKFQGIQKLDMLVTGSGKDEFNSNKFT